MAASDISNPDVLDELESHLREDIEAQMRAGVGASEAFTAAVRRIGQGEFLRSELEQAAATGTSCRLRAGLKVAVAACVLLGVLFALAGPKTGVVMGGGLFGGLGFVLLCVFGWQRPLRAFAAGPGSYPLTAEATLTLEAARREALSFHHDFVGTESLLLGLLESEQGMVAQVLARLGTGREAVRREVQNLVPMDPDRKTAIDLPCTPRAKRALGLAATEAKAMQHELIRPEHLLLGLLLEGTGVAALALRNLGMDVSRTRDEVRRAMATGGSP
jgi:hypothetical protein